MKEIIIDKTQVETCVVEKTQHYPHIIFILDKSGSMGDIVSETIANFNIFLDSQKELSGEAYMTLVLFDSNYTIAFSRKKISETDHLTYGTYHPSGYTALHDAIGKTISDVKDEKPLVVILTDGEENMSKEYKRSQIREMINKREKEGWEFMFLGANQDSFKEAGSLGISLQNTQNWNTNAVGTQVAFSNISTNTIKYRNNYNKN